MRKTTCASKRSSSTPPPSAIKSPRPTTATASCPSRISTPSRKIMSVNYRASSPPNSPRSFPKRVGRRRGDSEPFHETKELPELEIYGYGRVPAGGPGHHRLDRPALVRESTHIRIPESGARPAARHPAGERNRATGTPAHRHPAHPRPDRFHRGGQRRGRQAGSGP